MVGELGEYSALPSPPRQGASSTQMDLVRAEQPTSTVPQANTVSY